MLHVAEYDPNIGRVQELEDEHRVLPHVAAEDMVVLSREVDKAALNRNIVAVVHRPTRDGGDGVRPSDDDVPCVRPNIQQVDDDLGAPTTEGNEDAEDDLPFHGVPYAMGEIQNSNGDTVAAPDQYSFCCSLSHECYRIEQSCKVLVVALVPMVGPYVHSQEGAGDHKRSNDDDVLHGEPAVAEEEVPAVDLRKHYLEE